MDPEALGAESNLGVSSSKPTPISQVSPLNPKEVN